VGQKIKQKLERRVVMLVTDMFVCLTCFPQSRRNLNTRDSGLTRILLHPWPTCCLFDQVLMHPSS